MNVGGIYRVGLFSLLALFLSSICISSPVAAEVEMRVPYIGRALSWDGRVSISPVITPGPVGSRSQTWRAHAIRPRRILSSQTNSAYPDLSNIVNTSFDGVTFTKDGEIFQIFDPQIGEHASISKDPGYDSTGRANPYRCDENSIEFFRGLFECYNMLVYSSASPNGVVAERYMQAQYASVRVRAFSGTGAERHLAPQVVEAKFISDLTPLGVQSESLFSLAVSSGNETHGIEGETPNQRNNTPSITQGNNESATPTNPNLPPVNSPNNSQPTIPLPSVLLEGWEPSTTADARLMFLDGERYSYNFSEPFNLQQWSEPRLLDEMYLETASFRGLRFKDLYPIAREQLRDAQGDPIVSSRKRLYIWVSHDGQDLTYEQAKVAYPNNLEIARAGFTLIGASTNYVEAHIDGPINRRRLTEISTVFSPGQTQTMWDPYPEHRKSYFPYMKDVPAYLIYTIFGKYDEVAAPDFLDRDYLFSLPMNELIASSVFNPDGDYQLLDDGSYQAVPGETSVSHSLTPDHSGRFHTGRLMKGAKFPTEYFRSKGITPPGAHENIGYVGRGIYFPSGSHVLLDNKIEEDTNPNAQISDFAQTWPAMTVELAAKPLARRKALNLFFHAGFLRIVLSKTGRLVLRVRKGGRMVTERVNKTLPLDEWTHIAVSLAPNDRMGKVYVNGVLKKSFRIPTRHLRFKRKTHIGPNNTTSIPDGNAIVIIDEVKVSTRERTVDEIYRSASRRKNQVDPAESQFLKVHQLQNFSEALIPPLGLDISDMMIPREVAEVINRGKYEQAIVLGRRLFFDVNLTGKNKACASCHNAPLAFTDGNRFSVGAHGELTRRNTPTILNRSFSTSQFFDGRAESLVEQVLVPITDPIEMDGSIPEVLDYVNTNPWVLDLFLDVFGEPATEQSLAVSLASFVMSEMRANSFVDQLEAGSISGPPPAPELWHEIVRGKEAFQAARCTSCHMGGNYSDEKFHNIGSATPEDTGRSEITGSASDFGAFKTPTLRAISETGPYFHDGSKQTLREVIDHYLTVPQTEDPAHDPEFRAISLSERQIQDLITFLEQL